MKPTLSFIFGLFLLVSSPVRGEIYSVSLLQPTDTVYFRSTARLEFIEGKTNDLTGSVDFDPESPDSGISGILRVDLRTLRTGIETRDGHMRDNHLDTDEYPFAFFELSAVPKMPDRIVQDSTYSAVAEGLFYIHGVKRKLEAELSFSRRMKSDGNGRLLVRAKFQIALDDYKIKRPKALFLKLAKVIEVETVFQAASGEDTVEIILPNWPELQ